MASLPCPRGHCRVVTLHTTAGNISIELYDTYAPQLTENFLNLAASGCFDETMVHRLVPGQYLQMGALVDNAAANELFLDDELHPALRHTGAGIVSCASAGPDLNASQFLISLCPQPKWDGVYSIIGRVSSGMKVLVNISRQWEVDPSTFEPYNKIHVTHCSHGTYPAQRRPLVDETKKPKRMRDGAESMTTNGMSPIVTSERKNRSAVAALCLSV